MATNDVFATVRRRFSEERAPLLHRQLKDWSVRRPLAGFRVLHNCVLKDSSILKIDCLVSGGADLVVVPSEFVDSDSGTIALLREAGVTVYERQEDAVAECAPFDFVLDCCAELGVGHSVKARRGYVELTQTGEILFEANPQSVPVLSIDSSRIKRLEDALGSSDGFMRALEVLLPEGHDLNNKTYVVFGYGKVGRGICHRLARLTSVTVVAVDVNPAMRAEALGSGDVKHALHPMEQRDELEKFIREAYIVVTATGVAGVVSSCCEHQWLDKAFLANIGVMDEFGGAFESHPGRLFGGRPVNFVLEEPTTMEYLDPAFYAHNAGLEVLLSANYRPGCVHFLPGDLDDCTVAAWEEARGETLPPLFSAGSTSRVPPRMGA